MTGTAAQNIVLADIDPANLTQADTTDYAGNLIYENNILKKILVDGGYYDCETAKYCFYITDHQGNSRAVADAEGNVLQRTDYYPFGQSFAESQGNNVQPYKYNGKELDTQHGLNLYDYSARHMDAALGRFPTVDPMAEKYYSISPYAYCANNPVNAIDLKGDTITALDIKAQQMILNTLTTEDMKNVVFGSDGRINLDLMKSYSSESGNYNDLLTLATSDLNTLVELGEKYVCQDNDGNIKPEHPMSYFGPDPEYVDSDGSTPGSVTTGETGFTGKTLLPGKGISGENSIDGNIRIIINRNLSPAGRAEIYSHEANGHALMYVKTRDRGQSGHVDSNGKENRTILPVIIRSKMETVRNMRSR